MGVPVEGTDAHRWAHPWGHWAAVAMALGMAVKLWIALTLPLGVDEAYQIAVARDFSLSFFDHPPLSFWAPAVSAQVFGENLFAYRLPFLAAGLGTGWLLYRIGDLLGGGGEAGARAGFWTLTLFLLAPHMALGSGAFVLPDGILNLGGALVAYALVRMVPLERPPLALWALAGLGLAVALASKYQAGLIPIAVLSFIALTPSRRGWLAQPGFWLVVAAGGIGAAPVLLWNIQNDWISLAFHGDRTERSLQLGNFAVMVAGQLAYLLPLTAGLALWRAGASTTRGRQHRILAHLALWPIVIFNGIYLFSDASFPHWTMPGFLFALPLAGLWIATHTARVWRWGTVASAVPVWAALGVVTAHLAWGVLSDGGLKDWDRTEEVFNWAALGPALRASGALEGADMIAAESWIEGGQLSTGVAMGLGAPLPIRLLDQNAHHFQFLRGAEQGGRAVYLVPDRVDRLDPDVVLARAQLIDPQAQSLGQLALPRGGGTTPYAGVVVIGMTIPDGPLWPTLGATTPPE